MDVDLIGAIFGPLATIAAAVIGYFTVKECKARETAEREREKREEEQREREEDRRRVGECIMGMTAANSDALLIVLKHLHGEKLNGDVERAIHAIETERDEYSQTRDHITANL